MSGRLDSWKEIADHLGRDVRTVQRWESERNLPVHRLPGTQRPRVYALKAELDHWLQGGVSEPESALTPSIAVLPFANLTDSKENAYFSDGLADEILNALTRIPNLRVTARTSSFAFRGKEQDVREIGTRLNAATLLEGSVQRSGNQVRVSVQLVSTKDGYHLWAESFDRELADIFAIQDEIARAISKALKIRLAAERLVEASTSDLEAYRLWLEGRYAWSQLTPSAIARARELYTAAIARDPQFPLPYLGMAELLFDVAQFGLVLPSEAATGAKQSVIRAIELNDKLGEAHALLGALLGVFEYDWGGAEHSFRRALDLSPGSAMVLMRHSWYHLVPQLRLEEALDQMRRALASDPFSPFLRSFSGLTWLVAGDYERAVQECRTALGLAPGLYVARWFLGGALLFLGKKDEAIAECLKCYQAGVFGPMVVGGMGAIYGLAGRMEEAREKATELEEISRTSHVPPLAFAWAYICMGDERVFYWLEKAIEARDPAVTHMPSMPIFDGIRSDPRFHRLLEKMNLA